LSPVLGDEPNKDVVMLTIVWAVALVLIVLLQYMIRSPWGRVLKSIREDEDAAAALGKNAFAYKLQALGVGAALGAIAGLFYAFQLSFFSPNDFDSAERHGTGACPWAPSSSASSSPARASSTSRPSRTSSRLSVRTCGS
jgi:ABC-type branched-subunit amino acid transport system permease subunit